MKRFVFLLALPYVVTVTDMGKICNKFADGKPWYDDTCIGWGNYKRYHLTGFQDCVSSSTAQCDYMYDIATGLNMAAEKREAK